MRRILVKEEFIKMDNLELQRLRKNATKSQNLTYWLENYTENLYTQTAKDHFALFFGILLTHVGLA